MACRLSPFRSLETFKSEVLDRGLGFIVLAKKLSTPIAAAVFFHTERNAIFKFGASDERYQQLRPNNLVMWHAIRHLAENGIGGASPRSNLAPQRRSKTLQVELGSRRKSRSSTFASIFLPIIGPRVETAPPAFTTKSFPGCL